MAKYLVSEFLGFAGDPIIAVMPEDSLESPIYTAVTAMRQYLVNGGRAFVVELPDGLDPTEAVLLIRANPPKLTQAEYDIATLEDWALSYLDKLSPRGIVATTHPSPVAPDDVRRVLERIAQNPKYQHQTFRIHTNTGSVLKLKDGKIN